MHSRSSYINNEANAIISVSNCVFQHGFQNVEKYDYNNSLAIFGDLNVVKRRFIIDFMARVEHHASYINPK